MKGQTHNFCEIALHKILSTYCFENIPKHIIYQGANHSHTRAHHQQIFIKHLSLVDEKVLFFGSSLCIYSHASELHTRKNDAVYIINSN